ncbi:hypothetical protein, partial [Enterobacter cloacae complex sp. 2DZ2F20B]|uniref:hypothetical protein n=1 Tax=Enterobacter cloacae complex sp. 2DZ2F20B TaxID=2511993 RepID=UPI001025907C
YIRSYALNKSTCHKVMFNLTLTYFIWRFLPFVGKHDTNQSSVISTYEKKAHLIEFAATEI